MNIETVYQKLTMAINDTIPNRVGALTFVAKSSMIREVSKPIN